MGNRNLQVYQHFVLTDIKDKTWWVCQRQTGSKVLTLFSTSTFTDNISMILKKITLFYTDNFNTQFKYIYGTHNPHMVPDPAVEYTRCHMHVCDRGDDGGMDAWTNGRTDKWVYKGQAVSSPPFRVEGFSNTETAFTGPVHCHSECQPRSEIYTFLGLDITTPQGNRTRVVSTLARSILLASICVNHL